MSLGHESNVVKVIDSSAFLDLGETPKKSIVINFRRSRDLEEIRYFQAG